MDDYKTWTPETEMVLPTYAEQVKGTQQADSYTLDDLMMMAHWMSTDENHADSECVNGYKECLTPDGWIAFIAALANACMMEEQVFHVGQYVANTEYFRTVRKHVLSMQWDATAEGRVMYQEQCKVIDNEG